MASTFWRQVINQANTLLIPYRLVNTALISKPIILPTYRFKTTQTTSNPVSQETNGSLGRFVGLLSQFTPDMSKAKLIPSMTTLPTYQVLDADGIVISPEQVSLIILDEILYNSQRQGRISFYMTCTGEEAIHFGSAAALDSEDMVYAQYREAGVLMYRGFTIEEFLHNCCASYLDQSKGRQMPVHYGSKKFNYQQISSPLGTQIPQAVGMAYSMKVQNTGKCVIVYFGEGAASEGDCHAALNFASTLNCPVLFFCRNNGYAISTPATDQYAGDGIACRAIGYGMEAVRVDGNDILAVYNVVSHYRNRCINESKPFLIEAMTYRVGHHSTSDDWTAYRNNTEVEELGLKSNPRRRLYHYLVREGVWSEEKDIDLIKNTKKNILSLLEKVENLPKPGMETLFSDVYDQNPPSLDRQEKEMYTHINKYKEHYPQNFYNQHNE